ncbi:fungal-specific transcription factor domain-containing protein [Mycena polygramma]|nr:fungal-specific transcription factor domain-containing protein [Mycena polygramma]
MNRNGSEQKRRQRHGIRRIRGSCDACKRQKIRCDSSQMRGNRCTPCVNAGLDCTHSDRMKTELANGYVSALETRVDKMEKFLAKLLPGIDFTEQFENGNQVEPFLRQEDERLPRNDEDNEILSESFSELKLNPYNRFFGNSSGAQLLQTVLNFQKHSTGVEPPQFTRPEFWTPAPWILPPPVDIPPYTFPDADLLAALVDLYFEKFNPFWPLLHRPTFDRKLTNELHLRDPGFASVLLMVCSLGARHSDDPRVLLDGVDSHFFQSAGWKWHSQVRVIPKHLLPTGPDLYELQTIALSALYHQVISPTTICWYQIGVGLRRAQDVGAHRRRNQPRPAAEHEEWKRVFWVLLCLEWVSGTLTGRPLAIHDGDFDLDLPADCDDEYWNQNFQQPTGKPSELSYFICYIKLLEIQASVTTTLYSPREPKDLCGSTPATTDAQHIAKFDSALNSWLNDVPEHLRWDPDRENALHSTQSALLYTAYYNVQILVHRPFIATPFNPSPPGSLPSLAICTNAARSCVRIIDNRLRSGISVNHNMLPAVFMAGIVLILSAWINKKSDSTYDSSQELDHVYSCLRIMTEAEKRHLAAGRLTDILNRLLYAGGSHDWLFESNSPPTVPPSAQRGHGISGQPPSLHASPVMFPVSAS